MVINDLVTTLTGSTNRCFIKKEFGSAGWVGACWCWCWKGSCGTIGKRLCIQEESQGCIKYMQQAALRGSEAAGYQYNIRVDSSDRSIKSGRVCGNVGVMNMPSARKRNVSHVEITQNARYAPRGCARCGRDRHDHAHCGCARYPLPARPEAIRGHDQAYGHDHAHHVPESPHRP